MLEVMLRDSIDIRHYCGDYGKLYIDSRMLVVSKHFSYTTNSLISQVLIKFTQ